MKTEGEFNRFLGKEFRKMKPDLFHIKISDRFQNGVSDFLLIKEGKAVALEVKFLKKVGSGESRLLSHPFTGTQLSFFKNFALSGGKAFGLIAVAEQRKVYILPFSGIGTGNWSKNEFRKYAEVFSEFNYDRRVFSFNEVNELVSRLFKEDTGDGNKEST